MAQGRRDFAFGLEHARSAYRALAGPKQLWIGLNGHAPSSGVAADTPAMLAASAQWFDRYLRGDTSAPLARPVAVSPENWRGQPRRFAGLPKVIVRRPTQVTVRKVGPKAISQSGRERIALPRLRRATEVFGSPTVDVTANATGGWNADRRRAERAHPGRQGDRRRGRRRPGPPGKADLPDLALGSGDVPPAGLARHAHPRLVVSCAEPREPPLPRPSLPAGRPARRHGRHGPDPGARDTDLGVRRVLLAAVAVLAAATAATAATAEPGVTATTILIGGTVPLSGEAAAFGTVGPGAKAYFDYVNSKGGVHGRKIEYRYYDDAYNPAQTVQQTRRLVEQDGVLAIFNAVGTANNLAIRDYLNAQKVPQLFAGDGSQALGGASARYPWTVGFLPSYRGEGAVLGRDLVQSSPKARVAVLLESTELGKDMTRGLSRAIAGKGPRIVASQSYELTSTDVVAQVAKLKASGADTLMLFATPKFLIQAVVATQKLGWKPQLYLASVSIEPTIMAIARANAPQLTRGARAIAFVKNPSDPVWRKDPAVALYTSILKRFAPGAKTTDVYHWYGMTVAWTMVDTLRRAGKNLTRAGLLRAARSLDTTANPFLLPGTRLRTSEADAFPLDTVHLYRYDNRQWVRAAGPFPAR